MARVLPLLTHLDAPTGTGRVRMDRFSPYWSRPDDYGLSNVRPYPAYRYVYGGVDGETLSELAYYFVFDCDSLGDVDAYVAPARDLVLGWQQLHPRPELRGELADDRIIVADTRAVAAVERLELEPELSRVLALCDDVASTRTLWEALSVEDSVTLAEVEEMLAQLRRAGLIVSAEDSHIGLIVLGDDDLEAILHRRREVALTTGAWSA